ncbi:unnamed protein product [Onchocerca ochengi]|nr:unnamed protein product [Onchocerca ochengi]
MVDIMLGEDENSSPSSPELQNDDVWLIEQARKMFLLCDHNGKGFVVKMDLARIDGMIPNISQQQMELFFDNADIFKTNYITENQFIDNIIPILLRNASGNSQLTKTKETEERLYLTKNGGVSEENGEKIVEENEQKRNEKEMNGNATNSERKAMDSTKVLRQSVSAGILTELDKASQSKELSEITGQQQQQYSAHNGNKYDQDEKGQQIYDDFTGSLKDELLVAAIGTDSNGTVLHAIE